MAKKTKETLDKIFSQAKDSIKVLELLQKEAVSRAKSIVSNKNIVDSLRKMGLATQTELRDLERKVEDLASELRAQISKLNRKSSGSKKEESTERTTPPA